MRVRLGFVAMAMSLHNASPSKTMTLTNFEKIADKDAALQKVVQIAARNLHNCLRILRHAHAEGVHVYRFSSRLIPLFGHEVTREVDFFSELKQAFTDIGSFVTKTNMRVSFHPDHFTLLNSPKEEVIQSSLDDLSRHVRMFEAMGLDHRAKLVMHVGGGYKSKQESLNRFLRNWRIVPTSIQERLTLENDDKTYTARETLHLCQAVSLPMVLDIHHHWCNREAQTDIRDLLEPIFGTWANSGLVPKIHASSPKSPKDFRAHADDVNVEDLLPFLDLVREFDQDIDVMVEAKRKDEAVFTLMKSLMMHPFVKVVDGGSFIYRP